MEELLDRGVGSSEYQEEKGERNQSPRMKKGEVMYRSGVAGGRGTGAN
jgi:hypothetical protein